MIKMDISIDRLGSLGWKLPGLRVSDMALPLCKCRRGKRLVGAGCVVFIVSRTRTIAHQSIDKGHRKEYTSATGAKRDNSCTLWWMRIRRVHRWRSEKGRRGGGGS